MEAAQAIRADAATATASLEKDDAVAGVAGPMSQRTNQELLPVASALGIEGGSKMRRDELARAISRARSSNGHKASSAAKTGGSRTRSGKVTKTAARKPAKTATKKPAKKPAKTAAKKAKESR